MIVLSLFYGVPDRGHRETIMHYDFDQAGVAMGIHKIYGSMCVIEYASGYQSLYNF
jgi:hypothetical protein